MASMPTEQAPRTQTLSAWAVLKAFFSGGDFYKRSGLQLITTWVDGRSRLETLFPQLERLEMADWDVRLGEDVMKDSTHTPKHSRLHALLIDKEVKLSCESYLWEEWFPQLESLHARTFRLAWIGTPRKEQRPPPVYWATIKWPPLEHAPTGIYHSAPDAPASAALLDGVLLHQDLCPRILTKLGVLDCLQVAQVSSGLRQLMRTYFAEWRMRHSLVLPTRPVSFFSADAKVYLVTVDPLSSPTAFALTRVAGGTAPRSRASRTRRVSGRGPRAAPWVPPRWPWISDHCIST